MLAALRRGAMWLALAAVVACGGDCGCNCNGDDATALGFGSKFGTGFGTKEGTHFGDPTTPGGEECGEDPPIELLAFGVNTDIHANFRNDNPLNDRMKMAGRWSASGGVAIDDFDFDANGYPLEVPVTIEGSPRTLIAPLYDSVDSPPQGGDRCPIGVMVAEWDGTGDVDFVGEGTTTSEAANRDERTLANCDSNLSITIVTSDVGDPVTNLRVWLPDVEDEPTKVYAGWAETTSRFAALRMMNMARVNEPDDEHLTTDWASRVPETYYTQAHPDRGMSLEWQIDICNELRVGYCWFNFAHATTADYWDNGAALIQSRLDEGIVPIVEYTNEHWNTVFPVHQWLVIEGVALGLDEVGPFGGEGDPEEETLVPWVPCTGTCASARAWTAAKMYARQVAAMSAEVQDSCARCEIALGSFVASATTTDTLFDSLIDTDVNPLYDSEAVTEIVDYVAIAPYFGVDTAGDVLAAPETAIETICTWILDDAETETETWLDAHQAVATPLGVPVVAYEGGFGAAWNVAVQDRADELRRHPCMAEAQLAQLSAWLASGGGLFNLLGYIDAIGDGDGAWGALEHQLQDPRTAPTWWAVETYRAALDDAEATACESDEPPFVSAGLDTTCTEDEACTLYGTCVDDSGSVTAAWTEDCAGSLTYDPNDDTAQTDVTNDTAEECDFTLSCDDGVNDPVTDTATVTFDAAADPTVADAGSDGTGFVGLAFAITGSCTPAATSTWSSSSCSFDDANDLTTNATCTDEGANTITLECDDGVNPPDTDDATWTLVLLFQEGIAITPNFGFSVSDQLRAAYTGDAYLMRRHSDDTTTAVGFTSAGIVDTSGHATFCSGTTCSVQTLYDQIGSCDVTQATEANQPIVYESGALVVCGSANTPCTDFNGTNDILSRSDSCGFSGNEHVWIAFNNDFVAGAADAFMVAFGAAGAGTIYGAMTNPSAARYVGSGLNGNQTFIPSPAATTWASHILEKASGANYQSQTWETDGSALTLSTATNGTNTVNMGTTVLSVGALVAGTGHTDGYLSTIIAGDDDLTGDDLTFTRSWFSARN